MTGPRRGDSGDRIGALYDRFAPSLAAAATVIFYALGDRVQRELFLDANHDDDARQAAIAAMTAALGGSSVAVVLLAPFAIHAVWGYVEVRRLRAEIDAIESRGEPIRHRAEGPSGDAARAARYSQGAAALASRYSNELPPWIGAAERSGDWPRRPPESYRTILMATAS